MDTLEDLIKERKPDLALRTVKTYKSALISLHDKIWPDSIFEADSFKDYATVLSFLSSYETKKRSQTLCALLSIYPLEEYKEQMKQDSATLKSINPTHEKTEKQVDNWIEQEEIASLFKDMQIQVNALYKKKHLTIPDLQQIQNYIIIAITSGIFVKPRRILDWTAMKIKDFDVEVDNYIDNLNFVFNTYKTSGTYGKQTVEIPKELQTILKKWIKVNPTNWLLFSSNLQPLTSPQVTARLNKIFGKNASVNILRHSFLTEKFKDVIEVDKELKETAKQMGTSADTIKNVYIVFDKVLNEI